VRGRLQRVRAQGLRTLGSAGGEAGPTIASFPAKLTTEEDRMEALGSLVRGGVCALGVLTAGLVSTACATMAAQQQTPEAVAAATERRRCGPDTDDERIAAVLSGAAVERWERAYSSGAMPAGKAGSYKRLAGAVFTVRAMNGYSAEWLGRALECHSARRALGQLPVADQAMDPFWLPGSTVDIDVESTGKDYLVAVRSGEVADAAKIVARAEAFAAERERARRGFSAMQSTVVSSR
jgi:hypothetical protein